MNFTNIFVIKLDQNCSICTTEIFSHSKIFSPPKYFQVSPGCQLYPDELPPMDTVRDPCKGNKCREGRCVSKESSKVKIFQSSKNISLLKIFQAGYKCVCKSGYGGQYCDRKSKKD